MPFKPNERVYRSFAASNFRAVEEPLPEIRDGEQMEHVVEPSYRVRGHFTTFDQEYELCPGFFESIDPKALDGCDMSDVIFQYDHKGMVLARQRNGSLRVGIDPEGGWCEARLDGCQKARDLFEAIMSGLVDEMSFGFTIADDGFEFEEDEDGNVHSRITAISKLWDVSAVSIPANPSTDISARSYLDGAIEARHKQQEVLRRAEEERALLVSRRRRAAAALSMATLG